MKHDGTDPWTSEELELVRPRRGIEAIRAYRARTGCGLFEAKRAYDRAIVGESMGVAPDQLRMCPNCGGKGHVVTAGAPCTDGAEPGIYEGAVPGRSGDGAFGIAMAFRRRGDQVKLFLEYEDALRLIKGLKTAVDEMNAGDEEGDDRDPA
jgi:hypothetical protein